MNTKPTRMLYTAVALSALAAALASSAYAIPGGNGTKPPSRTVVKEHQSPQGSRTFFVDPEIHAASTSVTSRQQSQQSSVDEKLGEIGAWAVPSTSHQKPQLLQQTSVDEKLGEIGAWAVPVGLR
jgi:hypothetical protein